MSWTPTVTVTVDGVALAADEVLEGVTLERGRDGVDEQPRPGYARVHLFDPTATRARPPLDARLSVTVDDVQLFYGDVSDTQVQLFHADGHGAVATHTITATGVLARLHRRDNPDPLTQQRDGDRVATLLDALELRWPAARGTWADYDPTETWADAGDVPLDVDTPGTYLLSAISTPGDRWSTLQQAANDGLGQLAELGDGTVRYTDAEGRTARAALGFVQIPIDAVIAPGLTIGAQLADLANQVRVGYAGDAEAVATDDGLVERYGGILEHAVDTQLVDTDDALARAERLLKLRKQPAASLEAAVLELRNPALSDTQRRELLAAGPGTPVRIGPLPTALAGDFTGVIERMRWTVDRHGATADLALSDWSLSEFAVRWELLNPAESWADLDPSIAWNDAQELIA